MYGCTPKGQSVIIQTCLTYLQLKDLCTVLTNQNAENSAYMQGCIAVHALQRNLTYMYYSFNQSQRWKLCNYYTDECDKDGDGVGGVK